MFPLFPENRKSIPSFLCGKKNFKNIPPPPPPDFKFYLEKLNDNSESVFTIWNNTTNQRKQTNNYIMWWASGFPEISNAHVRWHAEVRMQYLIENKLAVSFSSDCSSFIIRSVFFSRNIWATTRQNQHSSCASSEDADQPGHPIRAFAVRMKKPLVLSYPLSAQRRLWSDWADVQADLSLRWAHTHFVGFDMSRLISEMHQCSGSHKHILSSYDLTLSGWLFFLDQSDNIHHGNISMQKWPQVCT